MTAETARPSGPLSLPESYDPAAHLIAKVTEFGVFHESRAGAALAHRLVANGTPEDLAIAEQVLAATLRCQETRPGTAHRGNFYWMAEDTVVEDLNAVEFVLHHLIPMMIRYEDRLPAKVREAVRQSIVLGLEEIRRLDVLVIYTNICLLDVVNTSLGGEYLGDAALAERGYRKLAAWLAFTDRAGTAYEYNSPTYTSVSIRALQGLAELVRDPDTRVRARTAAARLGLTAALHVHPGTGRWAGPHSRAYQPSVVCETGPEAELLAGWFADGTLPRWLEGALARRPVPAMVEETALRQHPFSGAPQDVGLSTYHSRSFSLGVSSREYSGQSNVCIAQFCRPGAERPGVLYTRYLVNDKWLGDSYHATDRTRSRNLVDEGQFFGVQQGARALGLYSPSGRLNGCTSAKAAIICTRRDLVDEIVIGDRPVTSLPADVGPDEVVAFSSGGCCIAVRPLTVTDLHQGAPRRLVEVQGDLVLELYNYRGPSKSFWDLGWPGAFFQGRPQCAFYLEVAERDECGGAAGLAAAVRSGELREHTDAPFTYAGEGQRVWRAEYARDGHSLGLEVDLMAWRLLRRWRDGEDLSWPMLESPVARQSTDGEIALGGATLRCGRQAAWLYADPEARCWVAGYHGPDPALLTLQVPEGEVQVEAMGTGLVVWQAGEVRVEAVGLVGTPVVTGGRLAAGR